MSDIVQIKELDLENAKKLIAELNPSQYRILENTLVTCTTDSEKREAIEKSYYLVFSIIWGKLLNTYSKIWKKVKTPYQCGGKGRVRSVTEYIPKSLTGYTDY